MDAEGERVVLDGDLGRRGHGPDSREGDPPDVVCGGTNGTGFPRRSPPPAPADPETVDMVRLANRMDENQAPALDEQRCQGLRGGVVARRYEDRLHDRPRREP